MKYLILFFLLFLFLPIFSQNLEDSLILHLPFNGDAIDNTDNGNLTVVHEATLTWDRFNSQNSAYYFDGINDFIEITPVSNLSNICDFTISIWFKPTKWKDQMGISAGLTDLQYLFDGHTHSSEVSSDFFRNGFNVIMALESNYNEVLYNSTFKDIASYTNYEVKPEIELLDNWHHNVFVRNSDTTFHYLNGKLIKKNVDDGFCFDMQHKLYLGTSSGNNPNYNSFNYNYAGVIDDIRIYNRALDSTDISYLYYGTCGINEIIYDSISVSDTLFIDVSFTSVDNSQANRIKVYPNPTKDIINIYNGDFEWMSEYKIKIISTSSEIIFESLINTSNFQIDISNFRATGLYFIQLYNNNDELIDVRKIILE